MLNKDPGCTSARLLKRNTAPSQLQSSDIERFWLEVDPFEKAEQYDVVCTVESHIWLNEFDWVGLYASSESADAEYIDCHFVRSFWGLRQKSFQVEFQCEDQQLIAGVRQCEARYFSWNGREYDCIRRCKASKVSARHLLRPVFGSVF